MIKYNEAMSRLTVSQDLVSRVCESAQEEEKKGRSAKLIGLCSAAALVAAVALIWVTMPMAGSSAPPGSPYEEFSSREELQDYVGFEIPVPGEISSEDLTCSLHFGEIAVVSVSDSEGDYDFAAAWAGTELLSGECVAYSSTPGGIQVGLYALDTGEIYAASWEEDGMVYAIESALPNDEHRLLTLVDRWG